MRRSIIAPAERVTNLRWAVLAVLGGGALVGGFDRAALVAAGPELARRGIDAHAAAIAFVAATVVGALVAGVLIDRLGARRLGRATTSLAVVLDGVSSAAGPGAFGALHGLLGLARGVDPAIGVTAVGVWAASSERGLAAALFDTPLTLSAAFAIPLLGAVAASGGATAVLLVVAALGALFAIAFFAAYRDPERDARLTHAEAQHLRRGGARLDETPAPLARVAAPGPLLAALVGLGSGTAWGMLLPWYAPSTLARLGVAPWVWVVAAALEIGGAVLLGALARRKASPAVRRLVPFAGYLVAGLALASDAAAPGAAAIAPIGLAFASPSLWSLPAHVAPAGRLGLVAGLVAAAFAVGHLLAVADVATAGGAAAASIVAAVAVLAIGLMEARRRDA